MKCNSRRSDPIGPGPDRLPDRILTGPQTHSGTKARANTLQMHIIIVGKSLLTAASETLVTGQPLDLQTRPGQARATKANDLGPARLVPSGSHTHTHTIAKLQNTERCRLLVCPILPPNLIAPLVVSLPTFWEKTKR